MAKPKKGAGGKLSRSETVTVRLDPKLKYAAELAARRHRRTLSSFMEWAVEEAVEKVVVGLKESENAKYVMAKVWSINEVDRFFNFALAYPHLLTHDEEILWEKIKEHDFLWTYDEDKTPKIKDRNREKLKSMWSQFQEYARGEKTLNEMVKLSGKLGHTSPI
jgi:hypothetical protein